MSGGCAGTANNGHSELAAPHVVSHLIFETVPTRLTGFFWLGNDEVMFAARPISSGQNSQPSSHGIYIWNVRQNTYRQYAELSPIGWRFNYDNGNIIYTQEPIRTDPAASAYMLGKMGQERRQELTRAQFRASPLVAATLGPRPDVTHLPGDVATSLVYHLRPEYGYLLVHTHRPGEQPTLSEGGDEPVRLIRPNGKGAVALPIAGRELGTEAQFWYSEYLGRYVILPAWHRDGIGSARAQFLPNEATPVYLLAADGDVRTEAIPPGPWLAAAVFPTRSGLFWVSSLARSDWKQAGGWILQNGRPKKLFDLPVEGVSVSPDGCTVSYAVGNYGSSQPWVAQALRLCSDGVQQAKGSFMIPITRTERSRRPG